MRVLLICRYISLRVPVRNVVLSEPLTLLGVVCVSTNSRQCQQQNTKSG